jgi:hypothetical protein
MRRKDIIAEAGIPAGTVAMLLTTENFDQDEAGRWRAKPEEQARPSKEDD